MKSYSFQIFKCAHHRGPRACVQRLKDTVPLEKITECPVCRPNQCNLWTAVRPCPAEPAVPASREPADLERACRRGWGVGGSFRERARGKAGDFHSHFPVRGPPSLGLSGAGSERRGSTGKAVPQPPGCAVLHDIAQRQRLKAP